MRVQHICISDDVRGPCDAARLELFLKVTGCDLEIFPSCKIGFV